MLDVILKILPLFLLIGVGAILKASGLAKDSWVSVMNSLALYVAFPALVFSSLTSTDTVHYGSFFLNSAFLIITTVIAFVILKVLKVRTKLRNAYLLCIMFANSAYLGLPVVSSVLPESLAEAGVIVASYIVVVFTLGIFLLESSKKDGSNFLQVLLRALKNPLLIAALLGILCVQFNVKIPVFIDSTIGMVSSAASPLVLFAIGIFIVKEVKFEKALLHAGILSVFRLLLIPLVFFFIGSFLFTGRDFSVMMIESAMPVAITVFALSEMYPIDKKVVAYTIVVSTVLSVVSIPLIIMLGL